MLQKSRYNPQIHNRRSVRLKGYDYSLEGLYFITICCHEKACLFGKIINAEMQLNDYGKIAHENWLKTAEFRPEILLDVFVIMPNHMHAVINIEARRGVSHTPAILQESQIIDKTVQLNSSDNKNSIISVNNQGVCDTPLLRSPSNTVGAIIRGYKASVTKQMNILGFDGTAWQRNYYEHIIKTPKAYDEISEYILNNPATWVQDKFYT